MRSRLFTKMNRSYGYYVTIYFVMMDRIDELVKSDWDFNLLSKMKWIHQNAENNFVFFNFLEKWFPNERSKVI